MMHETGSGPDVEEEDEKDDPPTAPEQDADKEEQKEDSNPDRVDSLKPPAAKVSNRQSGVQFKP